MAIKLEDKTRVNAPSVTFPYGDIRDTTPTQEGTPVNAQVYGDIHQFFAKMLDESGLTANDLPDSAADGFQYYGALLNVINSSVGKAWVLSQIGTYTPGDLVILYGCEVDDNIPGVSTITEGAIYYNGYIYYVPANGALNSPADTLVYKLDSIIEPYFIYLANDVTGSGLADFDAAEVKYINAQTNAALGVSAPAHLSTSLSIAGVSYKQSGAVIYSFLITCQATATLGGAFTITPPAGFKAKQQDAGGVGLYPFVGNRRNITDNVTEALVQLGGAGDYGLTVGPTGDISLNFGGGAPFISGKFYNITIHLTARAKF